MTEKQSYHISFGMHLPNPISIISAKRMKRINGKTIHGLI
jgi:hypothetical protein